MQYVHNDKDGRLFDYRNPTLGWGHSFHMHSCNENGWLIRASGHGTGIFKGDLLILTGGKSDLLYRVKEISYHLDPKDMWYATLMKEVPREDGTVVTGEKGEKVKNPRESKKKKLWPLFSWYYPNSGRFWKVVGEGE